MAGKDPICYCFEVHEEEIVALVRRHEITSIEQLQKYADAGMGCGSCLRDLEKIIARESTRTLFQ